MPTGVGTDENGRTTAPVAAVSFDFFNTLATHRGARGRGTMVMDYFRAQGWASSPWEHAVLYDIFAAHASDLAASQGPDELRALAGRLAGTLFRRLDVQADPALAGVHGMDLWQILGPAHLTPFPDTELVLRTLRESGYRLAVTSNWQHGLRAFIDGLGFGHHVEVVVASAEVGAAKPDARIFQEVIRRLALPPGRILHVGDSRSEDVDGSRAAGLRSLWLDRGGDHARPRDTVRTLTEILDHLPAASLGR